MLLDRARGKRGKAVVVVESVVEEAVVEEVVVAALESKTVEREE